MTLELSNVSLSWLDGNVLWEPSKQYVGFFKANVPTERVKTIRIIQNAGSLPRGSVTHTALQHSPDAIPMFSSRPDDLNPVKKSTSILHHSGFAWPSPLWLPRLERWWDPSSRTRSILGWVWGTLAGLCMPAWSAPEWGGFLSRVFADLLADGETLNYELEIALHLHRTATHRWYLRC